MHRPDRRAALRQPRCDGNSGGQHQPGEPVAAEAVFFAGGAAQQRAGTAVRYQTPHEKGAARRRDVDCCLRQIGTARIGMNERQGRLRRLDPSGMPARQLRTRIIGRRKDAETVRRQNGRHCHRRRLVKNFILRRADTQPDTADPGMDPGALGQRTNELGKNRGGRLAQVEYPEIGSLERQ